MKSGRYFERDWCSSACHRGCEGDGRLLSRALPHVASLRPRSVRFDAVAVRRSIRLGREEVASLSPRESACVARLRWRVGDGWAPRGEERPNEGKARTPRGIRRARGTARAGAAASRPARRGRRAAARRTVRRRSPRGPPAPRTPPRPALRTHSIPRSFQLEAFPQFSHSGKRGIGR